MGRKPIDVEKIATELIMSDDMNTKKSLAKRYLIYRIKRGSILRASMNYIWRVAGMNIQTAPSLP